MAFSKSKNNDIIEVLKDQINELKEERTELKAQVNRLQEALIAQHSPEAYRDLKADQAKVETSLMNPEIQGEEKERKKRAKIVERYLSEIEKDDYFTSVDELYSAFSRGAGPPEIKSLHGDDES